jgi:ketosteroid isomerase-like protein
LYDSHVFLVLRPEFGLASGEGVYCGPDEVARFMREIFLTEWDGLAIAGEEFVDAGDSVVVRVDQRGTGRQSRAPGQLRYFQIWTFRGPSVIRIESVMDRVDALEAVGLSESAMSQANVDLVLESIRRFSPSGLDEWAELWHQDTRMTLPEGWPEPGRFIGLDAVRREFERALDIFSALRFEDVEVAADSGDSVVATYRVPARGAASEVESDFHFAVAYRVKDGLLIECAVRWRVEDALEAAGLSE